MMEIKRITKNNIDTFESLLTTETAADIRAGLPVTALGVFGEDGCFGAVAGLMVEEQVFQITSLYVLPGYRRRGGGSMLLGSLNDLLLPFDARIEIAYNETHKDQKGLDDFLVINGYERDEDVLHPTYMTTLEKLLFSEYLDKEIRNSGDVCSFARLSSAQLNLAADTARKAGGPVPDGGFNAANIDRDLSFAEVKDDKVVGYVVVEVVTKKLLDVPALWVSRGGSRNTMVLLQKALEAAEEKYRKECLITATGVTDDGEQLIDHLFEGNVITRKLFHYAEPLFAEDELEYTSIKLAETENEPLAYVSELPDEDEESKEEVD